MDTSIIALVIPPLMLVPVMGLLSRIKCTRAISGELRRKALHVGTGLIALSFPLYLTESWMILTALSLVLGWMIAVRKVPNLRRAFGPCLHDTSRTSYGEFYFAFSLAALMLLTPDRPLLFVIPLLVLTLADSAAAVVGRLIPFGVLKGIAAGKTISGCIAFAVVAFMVTQTVLSAFTELPPHQTLQISLVIAGTGCTAELIGRRGLDNALIPAATYTALLFLNIPQVSNGGSVAQFCRRISGLVAV